MSAQIQFFKCVAGGHFDARREITDFVFPEGFTMPFNVVQYKEVALAEPAVRREAVDNLPATQGLAVGNHYHTVECGRHEVFVMMGGNDVNAGLFLFRYRLGREQEMQEKLLLRGDGVSIPPGVSHSFVALQPGARLIGFANMAYDASHDVPDKLF